MSRQICYVVQRISIDGRKKLEKTTLTKSFHPTCYATTPTNKTIIVTLLLVLLPTTTYSGLKSLHTLPEPQLLYFFNLNFVMSGCRLCDQPLVVELDPEDFDEATASSAGGVPATVPDDLALPCSCHFHWYVFGLYLCH